MLTEKCEFKCFHSKKEKIFVLKFFIYNRNNNINSKKQWN